MPDEAYAIPPATAPSLDLTSVVTYSGDIRETYGYNADGYVTQLLVGEASYYYDTAGRLVVVGIEDDVLRATTSLDALGRVSAYSEFAAGGIDVIYSRSGVTYDARGALLSETTSLKRGNVVSGLSVSSSLVTNFYDGAGLLTASESANSVNGVYKDTSRSDYAYVFQGGGAVQSSLAYRADVTKPGVFTTRYHYDANGHLSSAQVSDGRPRTVSFVNDAQGQVLVRSEADNNAATGDPRQFYYYANSVQVGSNGNNGNLDPSYRTALGERTAGASGTPGPFRLGSTTATPYADFDQSYDAINPGSAGNGTSRYTVRSGDTLQSIAASLFGDASLWYIIGEANGLTSSSALSAGQSITIPGKISNFHNNADTFRPYDASKAIGDTAPTTPRPPKKANGCGVFGQILLAAIAIAVTAIIAPAGAPLLTQIGAAVAGSVVSQGVGLATGIQDKFSFKGVALAALSAGIGGGALGPIGPAGSSFGAAAVRGAISNAITQGVAVATGLQKRFDFAGVAVAGVVAGTISAVSRSLPGAGVAATDTTSAVRPTILNQTLSGTAALIAGAGARSIVTGTSFGDNITAALPDAIGATIGNAVAGRLARSETALERLQRGNPVFADASSRGGAVQSDTSPEIVVTGKRLNAAEKLLYDASLIGDLIGNRIIGALNRAGDVLVNISRDASASIAQAREAFARTNERAFAVNRGNPLGQIGIAADSAVGGALFGVASGFAAVPGLVGAPRASGLGAVRGLAGGLDSAFLDDRSVGQVVRDNVAAVRKAGVIRTLIGAGEVGSVVIPVGGALKLAPRATGIVAGINELRSPSIVIDRAIIGNPLPSNGVFARVLRAEDANRFASGNGAFANPSNPEVFITAADDLKGLFSVSQAQQRLSLFDDVAGTAPRTTADTLVTFRLSNQTPIATPIETIGNPRGFGFVQGGRTAGGAREFVIPNGTANQIGVTDVLVLPLRK